MVDADLSDVPGLAVFPREGHAPTDGETKADYFDSLYHSAALVGLNTSAMIEAAIVGRPVLTVLDPEFEQVQLGTIHFRYLLEAGGGAVQVAQTLDEHGEQLAAALRDPSEARARAERFVASFVRPRGLDRPATPIFADEVERLAAAPPRDRGGRRSGCCRCGRCSSRSPRVRLATQALRPGRRPASSPPGSAEALGRRRPWR